MRRDAISDDDVEVLWWVRGILESEDATLRERQIAACIDSICGESYNYERIIRRLLVWLKQAHADRARLAATVSAIAAVGGE